MKHLLKQNLQQWEKQGLLRRLNPVEGVTSRYAQLDGENYLNFVSNNYLDLNNHPEIKRESLSFTERFGTGSSGSRLLGGSYT